ncbi:MAG: hydantoinase/oxoprolinase N-terminal domain-containing protein [Candidatus Lokiarchaeota archaeon]
MNELKNPINETIARSIALDTGGTMSDSFIIDDQGHFIIGKAQTTPHKESIGILNSINDALDEWGTSINEAGKGVNALVYSGTAMINRLLEREGNDNIGVIVNAGFEDLPRLGRALQCWIWLDYGGRLHAREHEHPKPLVSRNKIKGVRGRINFWGEEIIPLYKNEVEQAVENLLDKGVESICVCLLCSYMNPRHEK